MTSDDATIVSRLSASLPTTRWFADKTTTIRGVTPHERVPLPNDVGAELVLADVQLAGCDRSSRYVVMIDAAGNDAVLRPACARWLLDLVLSGSSISGLGGTFVGHSTGGVQHPSIVGPTAALSVQQIGGDASNTSLVVRSHAASWVIKVFRRCREGVQPEVEIGEFFATKSPWQDTPRLCGWLEYAADGHHAARSSTAIATVHAFAPGHTTGWERLVGLLAVDGGLDGRSGDTAFAIAAALGRATARMHRAFSARPDIPAFAPAAATEADLQATAMRMHDHAEQVFASIAARLPQVSPTIARRLEAVVAAQRDLVGHFSLLPSIASAASLIRVHGDYHLGQVLVPEQHGPQTAASQEGVLVIDFEGEPGRVLAERRVKTLAAKDVAGMCRSFDYLLRHVAKSTGRPYAAADLQRLEACYLEAYREEAVGQPWWPADRDAADAMMTVFKLDKAIYELAYELNNRPDWIDVPLAAVEEAVVTAARNPG